MYAVVNFKGFQFRVEKDELVRVPSIEGDTGSAVSLDRVCLLSDGENVVVGRPLVEGAEVRGEIVRHGRGPKIIVGKYKRRRDYRRRKGHRTNFTEIRVTDIVMPSGVAERREAAQPADPAPQPPQPDTEGE